MSKTIISKSFEYKTKTFQRTSDNNNNNNNDNNNNNTLDTEHVVPLKYLSNFLEIFWFIFN